MEDQAKLLQDFYLFLRRLANENMREQFTPERLEQASFQFLGEQGDNDAEVRGIQLLENIETEATEKEMKTTKVLADKRAYEMARRNGPVQMM